MSIKRWFMKLLQIAQEIVPEASINSDYYNNHIAVWKALYQGYYEPWHKLTLKNNKTRDMSSMQVAKMICEEMSNLVFTEKVELVFDNKVVGDYVKKVLKDNGYQINQSQLIEYMFALGGGVNKAYRKNGKTVIDYVTADNFIPVEWDNVRITAGISMTVTKRDKFNYILTEKSSLQPSEKGKNLTKAVLEYKLFKQKANQPDTKGVEVLLKELYPTLAPIMFIDPSVVPLFSYLKPNIGNNIDMNSPLGISIFANSKDTMKSLDICFDSFQREFTLGRKRITVPSHMLKAVKDPLTGEVFRYFDDSQDVYEGLNIDAEDKFKLEDKTQELRVEEHVAAINAFLNILCIQIHVSPGFISFDGESGLKTATEVISENSKTYKTKTKQEQAIEQNTRDLVEIIVTIGKAYSELIGPSKYELTVKFDDSIIEDKAAMKLQDQMEVGLGLMSKVDYIVKWHGKTEAQAKTQIGKEPEPATEPKNNKD